MIFLHRACFVSFLVLFAAPVFAQSSAPFSSFQQDPDQPVSFSSDTLTFDRAARKVVFEGAVTVLQGTMTLTADRVEVENAPSGREASDGIALIVALGEVIVKTPSETLEGDEAVFDLEERTLAMNGNVRLLQDGSILSADEALIDTMAGTGQFIGRVRSTFSPQSE